jgi:hypothetical protein
MNSIPVGIIHRFEHIESRRNYAVYKKVYQDGSGRVTYVIAQVPAIMAHTEPPSSVLEEFPDRASALGRFTKWTQDPLKIHSRRKTRNHDPAQCELELGPLQTKEEVLRETLRRQLYNNGSGVNNA